MLPLTAAAFACVQVLELVTSLAGFCRLTPVECSWREAWCPELLLTGPALGLDLVVQTGRSLHILCSPLLLRKGFPVLAPAVWLCPAEKVLASAPKQPCRSTGGCSYILPVMDLHKAQQILVNCSSPNHLKALCSACSCLLMFLSH